MLTRAQIEGTGAKDGKAGTIKVDGDDVPINKLIVGDMNEDGLYITCFPQGYFFVEWDILKLYLKPGFVFIKDKDNHWEI